MISFRKVYIDKGHVAEDLALGKQVPSGKLRNDSRDSGGFDLQPCEALGEAETKSIELCIQVSIFSLITMH